MSVNVNLKGLYSPENVARRLAAAPVIKTTIMDLCFPGRVQKTSPVIAIADINRVAKAIPVIRRGAPSISVASASVAASAIEPFEVKPSDFVNAADLNNLRLLDPLAQETWAAEMQENLRLICRATTEAMCAVALTGKLSWPIQDSGENYEVDFGATLAADPAVKFDDANASMRTINDNLLAMHEKIEDNGFGGSVEVLAGPEAFAAIYAKAEKTQTSAKMNLSIEKNVIVVNGYSVRRCGEKYFDPATETMKPKIDSKKMVMVATDASMTVFYAALDDLEARLQPLPFFVKPIESKDPSGVKMVGMSKPLPAPTPRAICWSQALAA